MTDKCKSGSEPCPLDGACPVQKIMEDPECDRVQIELAYYLGKATGIREIQKLITASTDAPVLKASDPETSIKTEAFNLLDNTCHGSCSGCLAKGLCHEIDYQYTVDCDGESEQTPAEIRAESLEGIEI